MLEQLPVWFSCGRAWYSLLPGMLALSLPCDLLILKLTNLFDSTYLLWESLAHIATYGPRSKRGRTREQVEKTVDGDLASPSESRTEGVMAEQLGQSQPHVGEGSYDTHDMTNIRHNAV